MNTESPTTAKPKRERTQAQKDANAKRERDRRAAKALAAGNAAETAAMVKRITGKAPASIWKTVTIDGVTVKVADSLSPEQAEAAARKLLAERAEKADAKDVDRVSPVTAAKAEKAKRKAERKPRAPRPEQDEARAPGAGSVVNGIAGRWVRLGKDRKWAHVPLHTEFEKKIGRDSYTSPAGSTEVFKNGDSFNAPRIPKA